MTAREDIGDQMYEQVRDEALERKVDGMTLPNDVCRCYALHCESSTCCARFTDKPLGERFFCADFSDGARVWRCLMFTAKDERPLTFEPRILDPNQEFAIEEGRE